MNQTLLPSSIPPGHGMERGCGSHSRVLGLVEMLDFYLSRDPNLSVSYGPKHAHSSSGIRWVE